jgi:hypothetical protein
MKLKSPKQPELLTLTDRFKAREDEIRKLRDEKDVQARERIRIFSIACQVLEAQVREKSSQAEKLKSEFLQLKNQLEKETQEKIKASSVTEQDLKDGKVSVHEFHLAGKRDSAIAEEGSRKAEAELQKPLAIIRKLGLEILELREQIARNRMSIERDITAAAEGYFHSLEAMIRELTERGVNSAQLSFAHDRQREIKQDLLYTKGYPGVRRWDNLKSLAEVEELAFNPIVSEKHLPELFKTIEELRGVSFSKVAISYYVQEFAGTAAGTFRYFAV